MSLNQLETFGIKPRLDTDDKFQAYEPLLEEEKKKKELVDEIFLEMKDEQQIPKYLRKGIDYLEKLTAIRNHHQSIY